MEKVRVSWTVEATYDCPKCEKTHDFMEIDEYYVFSNIETKDKFFHPIQKKCEGCGHEFEIDGSDY